MIRAFICVKSNSSTSFFLFEEERGSLGIILPRTGSLPYGMIEKSKPDCLEVASGGKCPLQEYLDTEKHPIFR
jgi:hypothetical protein